MIIVDHPKPRIIKNRIHKAELYKPDAIGDGLYLTYMKMYQKLTLKLNYLSVGVSSAFYFKLILFYWILDNSV